MSSIETLGISGFRSYNPNNMQKIQFCTPLTLIWGTNGSGKTTIIEVLKYITTGSLPPNSQRGKNFVMDPKIALSSQVQAETRLKFTSVTKHPIIAKRKVLLSRTNKTTKFQSQEQSLSTMQDGKQFSINHQCAEIQKQIPQFLGISKAILQKIVFCHQDESFWPFSDSQVLKNIFDELFQTKVFTKGMEDLWQQHKNVIKQIKEIKSRNDLLWRLYDQKIKRKKQSLKDMQLVYKNLKQLKQMQAEILKIGRTIQEVKRFDQEKQNLFVKKGACEQKKRSVAQELQKLVKGLRKINETSIDKYQFVQQDEEIIQQRFQKNLKEIEESENQKQILIRYLEQAQQSKIDNKRQIELKSEIKRLRQFCPWLKTFSSEQQTIKSVAEFIRTLEMKNSQLNKALSNSKSIPIMNTFDLPYPRDSFIKKCEQQTEFKKQIERFKEVILKNYCSLYRRVEKYNNRGSFDEGFESKLNEIRLKIKMKQEQLEHYASLPRNQPIKDQIYKLKFTGVQLYDNLCSFCEENGKCSFCSKTVTRQELERIKERVQKIKKKTLKKIEILQKQNNNQPNYIDPEPITKKLTQQVDFLVQREEQLSKKEQSFKKMKQDRDQERLNSILEAVIKRVQLSKDLKQYGGKQANEGSLQDMKEAVREYEKLNIHYQNNEKQIKVYSERQQKNRIITVNNKQMELKKQELSLRINSLQYQIKDLSIIKNIFSRISTLAPKKQSKKKKVQSESESSEETLQTQLRQTQKRVHTLKVQNQFLKLQCSYYRLIGQQQNLRYQLSLTCSQLNEINKKQHSQNTTLENYQKKKLQYDLKKQELSIKSDGAAKETREKIQTQYHTNKAKLKYLQSQAREIQEMYRSLDCAVQQYHSEKMDLINRLIGQIWSNTYHGQDITTIQIHSSIDQDSKKKKTYKYSVVMAKKDKSRESQNFIKVDMKGRCSMGQKVIASIVIRLALAQAFSTSTRILALDEPTTNLDQQHINNLANQLIRLIEANNKKNLQIIIISHDMNFIRKLEDQAECFYEVTRDQNDFSIITKKQIQELHE